MGSKYIASASVSVSVGPALVTSIIVSPPASPGVSGHMTLYNATAATAGSERMFIHLGTAAPRPIVWNDPRGMEMDNVWVAANSCNVTIVWE